MIGPLFVSVPLGGVLIYGLLAFRRSRVVGVGIAAGALLAILLAWAPVVAGAIAGAVGLSGSEAVLITSWMVLGFLVLVDVQLKLRRQARALTVLTRQIALTSRQVYPDALAPDVHAEPRVIASARPPRPIRAVSRKIGRRAARVAPEATLNRP